LKDELLRVAGELTVHFPRWRLSSEQLVDVFRLLVGTDLWSEISNRAKDEALDSLESVWRVVSSNNLDGEPIPVNGVVTGKGRGRNNKPKADSPPSAPVPPVPHPERKDNNTNRNNSSRAIDVIATSLMTWRPCTARIARTSVTSSRSALLSILLLLAPLLLVVSIPVLVSVARVRDMVPGSVVVTPSPPPALARSRLLVSTAAQPSQCLPTN
jgi:hypothetical protein